MIKSVLRLTCVIGFAFLLAGCLNDEKVSALKSTVEEMQVRVSELETTVEDLKKSNESLRDGLIEKIIEDSFTDNLSAFLKVGSDSYVLLAADFGKVAVKIVDIKAFANGSRVTLAFGNLSNVKVSGFKTKLQWGSLTDKGYADESTQKSRDERWLEDLAPGAWTNVTVTLEGFPPDRLGYVRLEEAGHESISLRRAMP